MGKGQRKGHGKGKWRQRDEERLQRDPQLDAKYHAPSSATSLYSTAFIFCLSLYLRGLITPNKERVRQLDCFTNFSRWLSWLFRHGKALLHDSLSLTLNELFYFRAFVKHIQNCLTYMSDHDRNQHTFGKYDTPEVREECRQQHVSFDSLRFFIPSLPLSGITIKAAFTLQL